MSQNLSRNPATPTARASKRQGSDADLRHQRKREMDKIAQRKSREKQRSHIAHLERTINILRKEKGSTAACELLEEIHQLRAENERLREIINSIKHTLGVSVGEISSSSYESSKICGI
jgi:hypothetical protein